MKALFLNALCTAALSGLTLTPSAAEEARFEDVEKAYHKAIYQKHKPILKAHLVELKALRDKATGDGLDTVVKDLDREISDLEKRIKTEAKALKALKDVTPLPAKVTKPTSPTDAPKMLVAPLAEATMRGGVRYDEDLKALVGWTSRQAEVSLTIAAKPGVTYDVELNYSTSEQGRLQVVLGDETFLPNLKDTGGMGKRVTLPIGEFSTKTTEAELKISLPIHRSKPFVQIHSLRLVPRRT